MRYPVAIFKDMESDYGVNVPDVPGCFSAGSTLDEALEMAQEAIESHLELLAEDGVLAPAARTVEDHFESEDCKGATWAYVDVDTTAFSGKSEKINVTLPSLVVRKIAQSGVKNRSSFLAEAAIKALAGSGSTGGHG